MIGHDILLTVVLLAAAPTVEAPLTRFSNSPGLSRVIDLNQQGLILGEREVVDAGTALSLNAYLRRGQHDQDPSMPDGFTHFEVARLSENGLVVGFAARPLGHPQGNQRACVWNSQSGQTEMLELPQGFRGSCAFDIDADGTTVCGYLLGRDPPRLLPCVWRRSCHRWKCSQLSALQPFNPFLTSGHVVISDDGQRVAASLVVESVEAPLPYYRNRLFVWERAQDGSWPRRRLAKQAVHLANINNHGLVVGRVTKRGRRRAFLYDPVRGPLVLPPLPGDVSCQATDVNNQGTVVGWSDDPPGPTGGTQAFIWHDGKQALLPLPPQAMYSSAETITDDGRVGGWLDWRETAEEAEQNYAFVLRLTPTRDDCPRRPQLCQPRLTDSRRRAVGNRIHFYAAQGRLKSCFVLKMPCVGSCGWSARLRCWRCPAP